MYKIIIFGTGNAAEKLTDFLNHDVFKDCIEIIAYADSNKQGVFYKKKILNFSNLKEYDYDRIIIGSSFYKEIIKSLKETGIESKKIIPFYDNEYWIHTDDEIALTILKNRHVYPEYDNGHYYSSIPNMNEIVNKSDNIFTYNKWDIDGVDLNDNYQIELMKEFSYYYNGIPFKTFDKNVEKLRYYFENGFFENSDAIVLYGMLRKFKPKRLIEIGSGFSSAVTLDTNELYFDNSIECTFIEPYPERLKSLLRNNDNVKIIEKKLQDVDLSVFEELENGDILFVDSTHVSKCGSDVNMIMFNILPRLKNGVIIHFHDVFFPFEYPKEWIYTGRFWNEDYLLRAFLQYNSSFKVMYFNSYMNTRYADLIKESMPLCLKNSGGSLWIRKE